MPESLSSEELAWFFAFLRDRSAIELDDSKEYLVTTRLAPLVRAARLGSMTELLAQLRWRPTESLVRQVVEAMTTNETSFFRDVHPFDVLRTDVFPQLVEREGLQKLNIWCAASSTGQEPYTIAMVLQESFPEVAAQSRILCTDINEAVLARTRDGIYSQLEVNRGLPGAQLARHFVQHGGGWQARAALRQMLDTRVVNLANAWPTMPSMDLVFLRNVMIYFGPETRSSILRRVRHVMHGHAFLFLGSTETLDRTDTRFARVVTGRTIHYRAAA